MMPDIDGKMYCNYHFENTVENKNRQIDIIGPIQKRRNTITYAMESPRFHTDPQNFVDFKSILQLDSI